MDTIKPNQGTPEQRRMYNFLKANPELADQLLKLFENAYDKLMADYIQITNDYLESHRETVEGSNISRLQDFLCETMEENMAWPNLNALNHEMINYQDGEIPTEEQREAWIQEISAINQGWWGSDPNGNAVKYDAFGKILCIQEIEEGNLI